MGEFFTYEVFLNYQAVYLLADAIERAKSRDRGAIVDALANSTWDKHFMPYGPTKFVGGQNQGARLVGIDVEHVFAMSFGIGLACLGAAACFLLPAYYVNPTVGGGFVLIAFTIVVLGGMGSFTGALLGGLLIGVVESVGGLWLGESLGQIGIFVIFIAVLLFRPQGLFGARA